MMNPAGADDASAQLVVATSDSDSPQPLSMHARDPPGLQAKMLEGVRKKERRAKRADIDTRRPEGAGLCVCASCVASFFDLSAFIPM